MLCKTFRNYFPCITEIQIYWKILKSNFTKKERLLPQQEEESNLHKLRSQAIIAYCHNNSAMKAHVVIFNISGLLSNTEVLTFMPLVPLRYCRKLTLDTTQVERAV